MHLIGSILIGFVGLIWGGGHLNHQCDDDIPILKVAIEIFSAVGAGYGWYKLPRWYYRIPAVLAIWYVVGGAAVTYLREVHRH